MSGSKPAGKSTRKTRATKAAKAPAKRPEESATAASETSRASKSTTAAKSGAARKRSTGSTRARNPPNAPESGAAGQRSPQPPGSDPRCLIRFPIDVRWRDLDAFNHVNNANFLTYVEEARLAWMQNLDGPWVTETSAPVLAAVQVNFRRPIAWPESLVVELLPGRVGSSSLTLAYRVVAAGDASIVYSDGETVMVWVDARTGKAASLPDAVKAGTTVIVAAP